MTRLDIQNLIASWLDDEQKTYFTSTVVNRWINLAQRQVQQKLLQAGQNYYVVPVETTTVANQKDYVLPTDFMQMNRLELVLDGTGVDETIQKIEEITLNEKDFFANRTGPPGAYFIKKDRITLLPVPDQAYTLRLFYSPIVTDLTGDSQSPDIPEQFMEYLAILACYDGFIKDDRGPENLERKRVVYEELLKNMANDRTMDRAREVVVRESYDSSGYIY